MTEPDGTTVEPDPPAESEPPAEPAPGDVSAESEPAEPAETSVELRPCRGPAHPVPAVESTRRLLGASFDLLTRTSDDMRRASFYIGLIVLGTVGPLALASFAIAVISIHLTEREMEALLARGVTGWLGLPWVPGCVSASWSRPWKAERWRRRSSAVISAAVRSS